MQLHTHTHKQRRDKANRNRNESIIDSEGILTITLWIFNEMKWNKRNETLFFIYGKHIASGVVCFATLSLSSPIDRSTAVMIESIG